MMIPYNQRRGVIPYQRRNFYGPVVVGGTAAVAKAAYDVGRWAVSKFTRKSAPKAGKAVTSTIARKTADKKKRKYPGKKAPLKKRVKHLEKMVRKLDSKYVYRSLTSEQVTSSANQAGWGEFSKSQPGGLESAFSALRYYDPAVPGTLVTAGIGSGTYTRDFQISAFSKITLRNNDLIPIDIVLYLCECKQATDNAVLTLLDAALADMTAVAKTSSTIYLTDGKSEISPYWSQKCVKKIRLMPGGEFTSTHSIPQFDYDPSKFDVETAAYQPFSKSFSWIVRVNGVICHDKTTTGNVGLTAAAVDAIIKTTYQCKYNSGGPSLEYIATSDSLDALAAGGVVSQLSTRNQEYALGAV